MLPVPIKDIELSATLPQEMVLAQQQLINWCDNKIASVKFDSNELKESYEHAKTQGWKSSVLKRHYELSVKRLAYYEKIREALVAGYYIIPNFQIDLFAIRTKKEGVSGYSNSYWARHEQSAQQLPIGEGEYKNPNPIIEREQSQHKDGNKVADAYSYPIEWDEFEFPVSMAKPMIMEATSRAMALKIFDEIGIVPHQRKEDPIIIGRIFFKDGNNKKNVSFMIAWHLNTNVI